MVDDGMSERFQKSKYMLGKPGEIVGPNDFPSANFLINSKKYSYEGNWLFCSFSRPDLPAGRIGFGRGKFDWRDYGIDSLPISEDGFFYHVEVIFEDKLYACVLSDPSMGNAVESDPDRLRISLSSGGRRLFGLEGWPQTHWHFENPAGSLCVDLSIDPQHLVLWPDMLTPRNTFSMCFATGPISGTAQIEGTKIAVDGRGFYDHPRTVMEQTDGPPFGWYMYAPIGFADGTCVLSYEWEDGLGRKDTVYSQGFLIRPDGRRFWLTESSIRGLRLSAKDIPLSWQCELAGPGVSIHYQVEIADIKLARAWGNAASDEPPEEYVALPLSMRVEGECEIDGSKFPLTGGTGIAEFLIRGGYRPTLR